MVIDHIEDHAESQAVSFIDESPKIVRHAVQMCRRKQVDSVISPAKTSWKIGHRHDLQKRDARCRQLLHEFTSRIPCALGRERSDVHLINHLSFNVYAFPSV